MTQGVLDLIQAIESGDSQMIDAAFNAEMATRVSDRLEDMRLEVAENMFAEGCNKKMKETVEEKTSEIELTAEELVELEAYMQTEEFEQLDELSKKTLGSYVRKASTDVVDAVHGERDAENDEDHEAQEYHSRRAQNRMSGLERVGKKLAK